MDSTGGIVENDVAIVTVADVAGVFLDIKQGLVVITSGLVEASSLLLLSKLCLLRLTLVARIDLLLDRSGIAFALDVANHGGGVGDQLDVGLMED